MSAPGYTPIQEWTLTGLALTETHGAQRVSGRLGGEELWFETADATLTPTPEAFGCAFLIPALGYQASLTFETPLCSLWMKNAEHLCEMFSGWWAYPAGFPFRAKGFSADVPPAPATGAFFSGGVDSFHTALACPYPIDALVMVQGFDIPLDDHVRMSAAESSFRRVAADLGKRAIVVRTNIRLHPLFRTTHWRRTHGAALAATAHTLSAEFGTMIISASYSHMDNATWGSHFLTDPYFSSSRLRVMHFGAGIRRIDRTGVVARSPIAQQHLRVCWENRAEKGNCSACEKCARTMLYLCTHGHLQDFGAVFDLSVPLARRFDDLQRIPESLLQTWKRSLEREMPPDVRAAAQRLIARSGPGGAESGATSPSGARGLLARARRALRPGR